MEQLLLVTSCDSPEGIWASLWTHTPTNTWKQGRRNVFEGTGTFWKIFSKSAKKDQYLNFFSLDHSKITGTRPGSPTHSGAPVRVMFYWIAANSISLDGRRSHTRLRLLVTLAIFILPHSEQFEQLSSLKCPPFPLFCFCQVAFLFLYESNQHYEKSFTKYIANWYQLVSWSCLWILSGNYFPNFGKLIHLFWELRKKIIPNFGKLKDGIW